MEKLERLLSEEWFSLAERKDRFSGAKFWQNAVSARYALDVFLWYSYLLLDPQNCQYYAAFDESGRVTPAKGGAPIPEHLPRDWTELRERYIGPSYLLTLGFLGASGASDKLAYPDLDSLASHIPTLSAEECAQYLLFCSRAALRCGQEFYFSSWRNDVSRSVVARMIDLQKNLIEP